MWVRNSRGAQSEISAFGARQMAESMLRRISIRASLRLRERRPHDLLADTA